MSSSDNAPPAAGPHAPPDAPLTAVTGALVEFLAEARVPTEHGSFTMKLFREKATGLEHVAMVMGDVRGSALVRVHSECMTGDVFGSLRCDCRQQLEMALALIAGTISPAVVLATPETDRALDQVKALGKRWDGEVNVKTRDIYVPLHKASRKDGVKVTRDVRYGPFERNRLDVVEPLSKPAKPMPVVIYVHGGGLTGILLEAESPDAELLHQLPTAVGAAIIDQDDFLGDRHGMDAADDLAKFLRLGIGRAHV